MLERHEEKRECSDRDRSGVFDVTFEELKIVWEKYEKEDSRICWRDSRVREQ